MHGIPQLNTGEDIIIIIERNGFSYFGREDNDSPCLAYIATTKVGKRTNGLTYFFYVTFHHLPYFGKS